MRDTTFYNRLRRQSALLGRTLSRVGAAFAVRPRLLVVSSLLPMAALMLCAAAAPAPLRQKPVKKAVRASGLNPATPSQSAFEREVVPVIDKYCVSCHGANTPAAELSLVGYKEAASVLKARKVWESVSTNISAGHMPPVGMPQPTQAERDRVVGWIDATISQADCQLDDPGRVTLRRLNREEYNNTVRDLLGVSVRPADDFPSDDVGYGFDNIGDVLSISPLLMEKYLTAAEKVAQAAIVTPEARNKKNRVRFAGTALAAAGGAPFAETDGRLLASEGEIGITHNFPRAGAYVLRVEAFGQQAGPEPARMALRLGSKDIKQFAVEAVQSAPKRYEVSVTVPAGPRRLAVAFLNDYYNPQQNAQSLQPEDRDRNLVVNYLEVEGPLNEPAALPASHQRIITPRPPNLTEEAWTRKILGNVARRAYRRPVTGDEVTRLVRYVQMARREGESFERGIQLAIQAVLVSPNFLFRVEVEPKSGDPGAKHRLGNYELASRLSYFLWSSMPDETLFALAAKGKLQDPAVLAAQVKRMLQDPKARALADNFAGQWLQLRKLATVTPDPKHFPGFTDTLRRAMRTETEMFFNAIMREDRSVLEFLDARFTFLNETLARHYGNTEVKGETFRRVALPGGERGGVLTQASVLTVTSNPTRTSPVKRGKWVLENILGTPPPPPPPGVAELPDDKKEALTGTLRQRLEQHRANPACASCHQRMDPIGFGLENFDAVGAWRTRDGGGEIDPSGTLADGKSFKGPAQLKAILRDKKSLFVRNLTERMLTYALGRGVESTDKCHIDEIAQGVANQGYRFSSLVTRIVQSDPFRLRRGDGTIAKQKRSAQPKRVSATNRRGQKR